MGSVPQHPFFVHVIESLQAYNRNWLMPYITVMYSTGPLFLSVLWKEYMREGPTGADRVRILMPDEYSKQTWSFFAISKGSSWHAGDAKAIFWMGQHWLLLTVCGIAIVGVLAIITWWSWKACLVEGSHGGRHASWKPPSPVLEKRTRGWLRFLDRRHHGYDPIDRTA